MFAQFLHSYLQLNFVLILAAGADSVQRAANTRPNGLKGRVLQAYQPEDECCN
eukprot:SAG11_NODE_33286_length_278_cov_0.581006_1_plen_52_part_01